MRLHPLSIMLFALLFAIPVHAQDATAEVIRQWATSASASSEYGRSGYSAAQALGEPDTPVCADSSSAWASKTADGVETLTVGFAQPVAPTEINIYQSFNPGAIIGIQLIPAGGDGIITVIEAHDPGADCPGVLQIGLGSDLPPIDGVIITLDQRKINTWNEIDAVELVGIPLEAVEPPFAAKVTASGVLADVPIPDDTLMQWADEAEATSQYNSTDRSAAQATGKPNTLACGNSPTAWASQIATGQDTLALFYTTPVRPAQLNIYQTYAPGSITGVILLLDDGSYLAVPDTADAGTPCPGVMVVTFAGEMPLVKGVLLRLDQRIGATWNQIDAAALFGVPDETATPEAG